MQLKTLVIAFALYLFLPQALLAHEISQPFVTINNEYVIHNPIQISQTEALDITHEVAPKNLLALQELSFKVDTFKLTKPLEWIKDASFKWDFGNGSEEDGLEVKHTYSKPGTYFIKVSGKSGDNNYQEITRFTLNILPMPSYKLPNSKIEINGFSDSSGKFTLPFSSEFTFSGDKSESGSSKITDYYWSFGDGEYMHNIETNHKFSPQHYNSFIVLRVTDSNGFIADSYIEIINEQNLEKIPQTEITSFNSVPKIVMWIAGGVLLVLILLIISFLRRKKL